MQTPRGGFLEGPVIADGRASTVPLESTSVPASGAHAGRGIRRAAAVFAAPVKRRRQSDEELIGRPIRVSCPGPQQLVTLVLGAFFVVQQTTTADRVGSVHSGILAGRRRRT